MIMKQEWDNFNKETRNIWINEAHNLGMYATDLGNNFTVAIYGSEEQFKALTDKVF